MLSVPAALVPSASTKAGRATWPMHSQPKQGLACPCTGTGQPGDHNLHSSQLPPVLTTPGQQALDQAKRHLLNKRQTNPHYASLPTLMGQTESVGSLKHKIYVDELLQQADPRALQELQHLLPDLASRWQTIQPQILLSMAADTRTIATRLLQLKLWFPAANVSIMVTHRPTLVLEEEFSGIPAAIKVLQHWFEADAIDQMVEEQPLFLVEDVETAISSLNRWMSTTNGAHKLQRNPQLLLSLVPNRKLSLW